MGYRWATQREAQRLGVTGWVRNLANGDVEAECYGSRDSLSALLRWCSEGPSFARVDEVDQAWTVVEEMPTEFTIR